MRSHDEIRIGKRYPPDPDVPPPDKDVPSGCERMRIGARTWRVFRKASAFELRYGRELGYGIAGEPDLAMRQVIDTEGVRPTSLIAVHKPDTRDRLYDLQLLRDLKIINERTAKELGTLPPGGLAMQPKRKPEHANPGVSLHESVHIESEANRTNEEESMKASHLVAIVALATGALSCQPASSTATTTDKESQAQNMAVPSMRPASTQPSPSRAVTQASKPQLGPEYKKIGSFAEFRKKLLADGWEPVVNPKCHEEMLHDEDYEDTCSGHSDDIYCRACDMLPEIVAYTAQGYLTTRYIKEGVPLSILSYGNISDFDQADRKEELIVRAWDYTNWD